MKTNKPNRWHALSVITVLTLADVNFALAVPITLNDGGVTTLEVVARDTHVSGVNTIQDLFPISLPFDGSANASVGTSSSQAVFHLGQDGFSLTSSGARSGLLDSRANVQPTMFFSVSLDTPYSISGALSVSDPGQTGKYASLTAMLKDVGTSVVLFNSDQESFGVVDQSFTLGGTAGNQVNMLSGLATGVLLAGHEYSMYYSSSIYASNSGDSASFVGSFDLQVGEQSQVPDGGASVALLGLSMTGLFALRRVTIQVSGPCRRG